MPQRKFEGLLVKPQGIGTWTYFVVPFDVTKEFGARSRIPVKGTIDGIDYKSTLLSTGDGKHYMVVKRDIRDRIGKTAGQKVRVSMERDSSPRSVTVPKDFSRALEGNLKAKTALNDMPYSHQKAYVEWIEEARKEVTRKDRIKKSMQMILNKARV